MIYTIYLLHWDNPIVVKQSDRTFDVNHYLGCTVNLTSRLSEHRSSFKLRPCLVHALNAFNDHFVVARCWYTPDKTVEQKLKGSNNLKSYCPICSQLKSHMPRRLLPQIKINWSLSGEWLINYPALSWGPYSFPSVSGS